MTTITANKSNIQSGIIASNTTATPTSSVVAPTVVKATVATASTNNTNNSSTVSVSAAALTVAKAATVSAPLTVAQVLALTGDIPAGTVIKDTAANISGNFKALGALTGLANISSITLSDTKAATINVARTDLTGDLSSTSNSDPNLAVLKKITSTYTLNVTELTASEALSLKTPTKNTTLTVSITDSIDNITSNLTALQTAAKSKSIASITVPPPKTGTTKPNFTITAAQLKANTELLATIKGDYDLTVTGVTAADAVTVVGNADKVLKASGSLSTQSKIAISDTSSNLVLNLKTLETAATAGRLISITVSDSKALVLTEAQIKADSHFLATQFTTKTTVEATAVAAADVTTVQSLVNANSKLTLTRESVADTAVNIQSNLDNLETAVKALSVSSASSAFTIANIGITDKGSITVTNSTLVNDIDALKLLSGPYTLNVTDISVSDALALKAPTKDTTLSLTIKDEGANIASNLDKMAALVKSKTIASINLIDVTSKALTLTSTQFTANGDTLKIVQGDYKLAVTDVLAKDIPTVAKATKLYSIAIKDTAANVLSNIKAIAPLVTAAKVASVALTDKTAPTLNIADAFTLKTILPNVTLPTGIKPIIADTASNVIAHARFDVGDVLSGASKITLTDKISPNLTLADAKTLKALTTLDPKTKYNVADGGNVIATQAGTANEAILSGAAAVLINKNFSITQAKAITGIKTLDKGTVYSINDTVDNILTQAAIKGETVLAKANAVNIMDTSTNILAKLDQLEVLAKAGKIADITFTDNPSSELNISQTQLLNNAEAIGKIVSQRNLTKINLPLPNTPSPIIQQPTIVGPSGIITDSRPIFSGISTPNSIIQIYNNITKSIMFTVKTGSDGSWFYKPNIPLNNISYSLIAQSFDNNGIILNSKDTINFTINAIPNPDLSSAYHFDEASGKIVNADQVNLPSGNQPRTYATWVKIDINPKSYNSILMYQGDISYYGKCEFMLDFGDQNCIGLDFQGSGVYTDPTNVNDGNPHFVAATFDKLNGVCIYLDGIQLNVKPLNVFDSSQVYTSAGATAFGGERNFYNTNNSAGMNGILGNSQIYNNVLTPDQIKELYYTGVTNIQPVASNFPVNYL